jgi:hypothetical protein
MTLVRVILALVVLSGIFPPMPSGASDGPFFHHVILKRNKYVTYKTHYPDDIYLCYEGDVDIPFQCYYTYNRFVHLVVEIVRPPITGFRRVDVVLYMGIDRKLVGMDREVSKVKTFIVNTPDVRPLRPFEKVFQEPENLNVRIKMYPEIAGKVLRQMNNKDIIKDDRVDRIPCLFKVWWQCN